MRSAGNFNSEWGYLAPAPSFMRTVRVVLVATAIGATAGAAVVLSLIDRPTTAEHDRTASITAHAIVTSAQAAPGGCSSDAEFENCCARRARRRDNGRSCDRRGNGASSISGARCAATCKSDRSRRYLPRHRSRCSRRPL